MAQTPRPIDVKLSGDLAERYEEIEEDVRERSGLDDPPRTFVLRVVFAQYDVDGEDSDLLE